MIIADGTVGRSVAVQIGRVVAWSAGWQPLWRPLLRLALALPFLRSGLTRWDGFLSLSRYGLSVRRAVQAARVRLVSTTCPRRTFLALLVAIAELVLPILLLTGLGTRLAASAFSS